MSISSARGYVKLASIFFAGLCDSILSFNVASPVGRAFLRYFVTGGYKVTVTVTIVFNQYPFILIRYFTFIEQLGEKLSSKYLPQVNFPCLQNCLNQ